jgi:hypothetical protein
MSTEDSPIYLKIWRKYTFFYDSAPKFVHTRRGTDFHIYDQKSADGYQLKLAQIVGVKWGNINVKFSELETSKNISI